jgi:hypothetical protein
MIEYKKHLTDVRKHDPANFVYIAHAFMDVMQDPLTPEGIERKIKSITEAENFFRASLIGRVTGEDEKQQIVNKYGPTIANTSTFGHYGFLVTPSYDEPIYVAWKSDLGSPNEMAELRAFALANKGKRKQVFHLLSDNVRDPIIDYNELVLRGDPKTRISAVFYQEDAGSEASEKAIQLQGLTNFHFPDGLPLIGLPARDPSRYDPLFKSKDETPASFTFIATDAQLSAYRSEFDRFGSPMHDPARAPINFEGIKFTLPRFPRGDE